MKLEAINGGYALNTMVNVRSENTETIIVDGKKFVHKEYIVKEENSIDIIKEENFRSYYEIDIDIWNNVIKFYDSDSLTYSFLSNCYSHKTSTTNDYVKACFILFENKILDPRIRDICTLSSIHNWGRHETEIDGKYVWIPIHKYGFNNYLLIKIELFDFFELGYEKIKSLEFYYEIERYFRVKYKVDISKELDFADALKLLKKHIDETN
jgi:hypothetical protein